MKFLVLTLVVAAVYARPGVYESSGSYLPGVTGDCSILSPSLGVIQSKPYFVKHENQAEAVQAVAGGLHGQAIGAGLLDLDNQGSFISTLGQGGFGGGSVGTFGTTASLGNVGIINPNVQGQRIIFGYYTGVFGGGIPSGGISGGGIPGGVFGTSGTPSTRYGQASFGGGSVGTFGTTAFLGNVGIINPNIQGQQILFGYYPGAFGGPGGGIPGGGIPGGGIPGGGIPGGGIPGVGIPGGGIPGGGIPGGNFGIINPNIQGQQILFGYYPGAFGGPGGGISGGGISGGGISSGGIPGGVFGTNDTPSIRYGTPGANGSNKRW